MATAKVTEGYLEDKLVAWAKGVGGVALKGATQFDTGYPDRIIYIPAGHAHVELKGTSTRYHLNDKQKLWAGRIITADTPYYIIETLEQLEAFKKLIYEDSRVRYHPNRYCLNGFNLLMYLDEDRKRYHVVSEDETTGHELFSGDVEQTIAHTIYKVFVKIEELYPHTNYADL